ncbi:MAG: tetratricopeptide repeat protein [Candidatus Omnitrophica bacterium]|nr:tetratricopeptide repeat protein [Candidatus Omnitrophota bacterium]MDD5352140.1 tetratricopeptide repeat protein [Candidatus Omnitrophota bacterium]MDD5549738.1 tetratricopeptide repeat protein [Candidatus Omnitrophota bacterium]
MKFKNISNYILIIILCAVSFAIYINSLNGDFLIDDQTTILNNGQIKDLKIYLVKYFKIRVGAFYELIRVLNWHISGDNPFSYHLFNVLAHSGCVILIFILCNVLFNNKALSFLSSLIFAVHPIHTEAVSWISGGNYVFSSLFFITAFIFYIKSDRSLFNLTLSIIAFSLCLLSGNTVATLPIMFILYDIFFRQKNIGNAGLTGFRILVLCLVMAIAVIFVGIFFVTKNNFMHIIFYFRGFGYLIVAAKAFVYYLKILYLPLHLGLYHPFAFDVVNIQSISPTLFLSIAILITAVVLFLKYRRTFKPLSFGIMWFLVTYAPYSNIIPICNIISERYLYLPSVGSSVVIAALFLKVWEIINRNVQYRTSLRFLCIAVITLFLGSYSTLTMKRNYEYNNIISYWQSNINNFKDGYIVYNNLAGTYYQMGNLHNAIAYCWINLMINPNQPYVWCNLGKVYTDLGDYNAAQFCYKEALKVDKNYFPAIKALEGLKGK